MYNDKGLQTAIEKPFLFLADVVMAIIDILVDLVTLPFDMIGAAFDDSTP